MRRFLLLLMAFILAMSQLHAQRTITGKVTDEKGDAIPNASVVIKGTSTGTTTSIDGIFSISVPQNVSTLVVSSIGMGSSEITLTSSTNYTISLSAAAKKPG